MQDIGRRLAALRQDEGLNQEELAERLGVSRQAVSKWERGESTPDITNLVALSELYGVSIDYLAKGCGATATVQPEEGVAPDEDAWPVAEEASSEGAAPADEVAACDASVDAGASYPEYVVGIDGDAGRALTREPQPIAGAKRRRSPLMTFPYPFAVLLLYLFLGFAFDGWHPWWLLFLTIPIYYWVAHVIVNDPVYMREHPKYRTSGR